MSGSNGLGFRPGGRAAHTVMIRSMAPRAPPELLPAVQDVSAKPLDPVLCRRVNAVATAVTVGTVAANVVYLALYLG